MDSATAYRKIEKYRILALALYAVAIALLVACLVSFFINRAITFPSLIATLLFYWVIVLRADRTYGRIFVKMNLLVGTGNLFESCTYIEKGGVTRSDIRESGMLPTVEREGNEVVAGPTLRLGKCGRDILVSSIISYYPLPAGADKHKISLLEGIWISCDVESFPPNVEIAVVRQGALHESIEESFYLNQGLEDRRSDISERWSIYNVYSSSVSTEDFRTFLKLLWPLLASEEEKKRYAIVRVHKGKFYLFVSGRNLTMDCPIYKGPSKEIIEKNRLPEVVELNSIISLCTKKTLFREQ